jgi:hypothetical protein
MFSEVSVRFMPIQDKEFPAAAAGARGFSGGYILEKEKPIVRLSCSEERLLGDT